MKEMAITDANEKAKIVLDIMDGIGEYVNQTLKPTVFSMLPELQDNPHLFVSEILSTTRIRNIIMEKSGHGVVNFVYKRLSQNPRNPINKLDHNYLSILNVFEDKREIKQWQGINKINGKKNLVIARGVYVTSDCLKCHGAPEVAPRGVISKYGEGGFGFQEGDVMGIELVTIPMDVVLNEITQTLVNIITVGMIFIFLLFLTIEGTFIKHVGFPLNKLVNHFRKISKNKYNENPLFNQPDKRDDEISQLINSFNIMIKDLNDAYDSLLGNTNTLQAIVNGISDPLALINADCSIVVLNNAYQEWISKNNPCVLIPEENTSSAMDVAVCQKFHEALNGKKTIINEYKTSSNNYYLIHFYPIFDKKNNVAQIVHYIQDLTHIKNIEDQIVQSEKMASIGKLAAGVAHEINNPLGIIKCYTDLLLKEIPENSPFEEDLRVIDKHIYSCKNIIDRLLYFSRNQNEEKEKKDLNEVIEEIILLVKKQFLKENIKIELNKSELPEVLINSNKIKQVFLNILMNARDAMEQGGTININSFFNKEKNQIEMTFSDTGCGILKEDMEKIFEPFFTTKKQGHGTGLGLFISYNLIKEHNGDIRVKSIPGNGTDFIIILPLERS